MRNNKKVEYWDAGEKAVVAEYIGISPQNFSDIIHRNRGVGYQRAKKLAFFTNIPVNEWMENRTSRHPAFYGKPKTGGKK